MPTGTMIRPAGEGDDALVQLQNMALVIAATTREMLAVRQLALDNQSRLDAARDYIRGINQRLRVVEQRTQAGPLTEEQAREIHHRVNRIAQELTRRDPAQKHHPGRLRGAAPLEGGYQLQYYSLVGLRSGFELPR